jgi:hypothetical protein
MPDKVDIFVEIIRETERAYLVEDGGDEVWIPKSQLGEIRIQAQEFRNYLQCEIPVWLAEDKGLI